MWVIFSILAAICWAVVNTTDKYVLTKWVRQPLVPVILVGMLGLIASIGDFLYPIACFLF